MTKSTAAVIDKTSTETSSAPHYLAEMRHGDRDQAKRTRVDRAVRESRGTGKGWGSAEVSKLSLKRTIETSSLISADTVKRIDAVEGTVGKMKPRKRLEAGV